MGFLQNAKGESSHTKLINLVVALCIMGGWCFISFQKGELVNIDPTLLGLLGVCVSGNSLNKWIENNVDKAKILNEIKDKIKARTNLDK